LEVISDFSNIDKTKILADRGEMSFDLFAFDPDSINGILAQSLTPLIHEKALSELLGRQCLPDHLINYLENFCPAGVDSIAVHNPKSIAGYAEKPGEINKATITRTKGFIGDPQLEKGSYPNAIQPINIFYNDTGRARVFYEDEGSIRFLKAPKIND
jgi:hypothetical protein